MTRKLSLLSLGLLLSCAFLPARPHSAQEKKSMTVKRITPILFVADIEPCVQFWTERLGFQKTAEVPEGDKLGFVMLQRDGVEIMYQNYASVEKDMPSISSSVRKGPTFLYMEVDNLDAIKSAVSGAEVYMPERTTFYGSREIGIKDPAGHYITFAQFSAQGH
jgi:uncharacterized glyoxalase superfamily protein PhnB